MIVNTDSIINELRLRIKLLENQNEVKAKLMEEKLLLWLTSETINQAGDRDELVYNLLERISVILEVSFSACCQISKEHFQLLNAYSEKEINLKNSSIFNLSAQLINKLRSGNIFLEKDSFADEGLYLGEQMFIEPQSASIFPFQSLYIPFGFFILFSHKDTHANFSSLSIVFSQIINMAVEKLDKLTLMEELKNLNYVFEDKLRERTKDLNENTKLLKQEIKSLKQKNSEQILEESSIGNLDNDALSLLMNIGHEIRTPLNGIMGFAEIIRKNDLSVPQKEKFINIIKTCGKSILNIVDNVIVLSKMETQQLKIQNEDFEVAKFMARLHDHFKNDELHQQRDKVELRLNININGNTIIHSDEKRLWQILVNLVGNALKYTEHGYIEIGCKINENDTNKSGKKDLLIFVKDSGIGIEENMQSLIFDRFFKIEHEISKLYGGTGLGLTIAKSLVEMLGGKIWFESKPGLGSDFYFTIPECVVLASVPERPISTKELKAKYNWDGKRVLIVEDDEMSYIYLQEILKSTKINIIHAKDGRKAVELAAVDNDIDLILMDIKLPEMDGYEATRKIKEIRHSLPVIAQTAYAMADDQQKSLQVGCDDYISKPINRRKLLESMEYLLK